MSYNTIYVNGYALSAKFESKVIRIKNDNALKNMLTNTSNGSTDIAYTLKQEYRKAIGETIKISTSSLAVEILAHVYPDKIAHAVENIPGLGHLAVKVIAHTDPIDCGESSIDSNRWIWDTIAPFHKMIFGDIVG